MLKSETRLSEFRLSRGPWFNQRSSTQSHWSSLALPLLCEWPPRSGWPGSRWAGVWDITTCCGQLRLATFLCGWTMTECVIRAECEGPAVWLWLHRGLTGAAGPLHRVPIIHLGSWHWRSRTLLRWGCCSNCRLLYNQICGRTWQRRGQRVAGRVSVKTSYAVNKNNFT